MKSEHYVYTLTVAGEDKPFYVGKGKGKRCFVHLKSYHLKRCTNKKKVNIIKQAQANKIEIIITKLHENLTNEHSCLLEIYYIAHWGRQYNGTGCLVNATDGGDGGLGYRWTDNARKKKSKSMSGENNPRFGLTGELCPVYGENNGFYGKHHTQETKDKIAAKRIGTTASSETKKLLSSQRAGELNSQYGINPWEVSAVTRSAAAIDRWFDADFYYNFWINNGKPANTTLRKICGRPTQNLQVLVSYFRNGWVPLNDDQWIKFKRGNFLPRKPTITQ